MHNIQRQNNCSWNIVFHLTKQNTWTSYSSNKLLLKCYKYTQEFNKATVACTCVSLKQHTTNIPQSFCFGYIPITIIMPATEAGWWTIHWIVETSKHGLSTAYSNGFKLEKKAGLRKRQT